MAVENPNEKSCRIRPEVESWIVVDQLLARERKGLARFCGEPEPIQHAFRVRIRFVHEELKRPALDRPPSAQRRDVNPFGHTGGVPGIRCEHLDVINSNRQFEACVLPEVGRFARGRFGDALSGMTLHLAR